MSSPDPTTNDLVFTPACSIFRRFLKEQGLKFTPERAKILEATLSREGVFEADELYDEMRQALIRVSKATIYRTLKHLLESQIICEVLIDSKQAHYQLSYGREPTAYLICLETNKIVTCVIPQLKKIRDRICAEHGFDPVSHQLVIYGISPEAQTDLAETDDVDS